MKEFSDSLELPYVLALLLPSLSLWDPIHQLPEVAWGWPGDSLHLAQGVSTVRASFARPFHTDPRSLWVL